MPRPKRTKVASNAPRDVSSPPTVPTSTSITDNIEGAMPLKKRGRGRPPTKKAVEEPLQAEGGPATVEEEEEPAPKANVRPRGRPVMKKKIASAGQQSALDALKQRRDAAIQAKKAKDSPAPSKPTATPAPKSNVFQRLQRKSSTPKSSNERVASTPAATKAPPSAQRERTPSSRLDTEEELYGLSPGGEASRLRLESRRQSVQYPQSALKAQGTPAVETSVLALTNFKRRPRQGSIIRMVQQTSELGDPEDGDDPLLRGLEDTLVDLEDFNPENESTPLNLGKRKSDVGADEPRTSSSRKRKHAEEDEEIQVPQSSPPIPSSPPPIERHHSPSRSSTTTSLPEIVLSTQKSREVDIYSDTMAPPQSSSDPASPTPSPTRADKRRKVSGQQDQEDEDAPSPARVRKQKPRKRAPAISTATLQSLLPKPRPKPRAAKRLNDYDFPSSDPLDYDDTTLTLQDDDDDELAQPKGRRATKTPMRKVSGNRQVGGGKLKKVTKATSPVSVKKKAPPAKGKGKEVEKVKVKKTYGRAAVTEQENDESVDVPSDEEDDDTEIVAGGKKRGGSVAPLKISKTKELEQAKKKFAEVDEWEMEFESVDLGGGSSSPWR